MEKSIVTTGKTIDLAIASALNQLGLDRDSVSVTVLQQAKSGFLGFGVQEPTPSWGAMLSVGCNYLLQAPWMAVIPGLGVALVTFACNFIGDGLRDAFDPKTRK